MTERDADRSGADVGAVTGSNFHPANRLYWIPSVASIWSVNASVTKSLATPLVWASDGP